MTPHFATLPNNAESVAYYFATALSMPLQLDAEAPMPYVRRKGEYRPEKVKFEYEKEITITKTITKKDKDDKVTTEEKIISMEPKSKKVLLATYSHDDNEDCEHFFDAFERLKTALIDEWQSAAGAQTRDATILFDAFDTMLIGTANTRWHDVLQSGTGRTWRDFKTLVALYINTKVVPANTYSKQLSYLRNRSKPMKLSADEWWIRMQTINRRLMYCFEQLDDLKRHKPNATFSDWWKEDSKDNGTLTDQALKDILIEKGPNEWIRSLKRTDTTRRRK